MIHIDKSSDVPLYRQIYRQISRSILQGIMIEGIRLMPSRELAMELGISRKPVIEAYELLTAEGYIYSITGSGSYVAPGIGRISPKPRQKENHPPAGFSPFRHDIIDFRSGLPDLNSLPINQWQRLSQRVLNGASVMDFAYQQPEGRMELRREICTYLSQHRGVECRPEQLVITSGTTQAIGIIASLFSGRHGPAVLEDPVTQDIPKILKARGMKVLTCPVDLEGLQVELFPTREDISFLYLTPSHQFPLGSVMPIARRSRLIDLAEKRDFYIVEDDYDSEFRYAGPPVSTFHSLAPHRVIYIGTFSKTLFPALRTAYMVLPEELVDSARESKWVTDLHNGPMNQLILSEFMKEGFYTRHIHRMKKVYRKKRDALMDVLHRSKVEGMEILGAETGLHLCVRFPGWTFDSPRLKELEELGVKVYPVSDHAAHPKEFQDTVILGYGYLSEEQLMKGGEILMGYLHS